MYHELYRYADSSRTCARSVTCIAALPFLATRFSVSFVCASARGLHSMLGHTFRTAQACVPTLRHTSPHLTSRSPSYCTSPDRQWRAKPRHRHCSNVVEMPSRLQTSPSPRRKQSLSLQQESSKSGSSTHLSYATALAVRRNQMRKRLV